MTRDPSHSAAIRRVLWPTVTGSRSRRKQKVHALLRLGYTTAPKTLADEIKRDFQIRVVLRPRLRCSRTLRVLPDGFAKFQEWQAANPIKLAHLKERMEAEYQATTGHTLIIDEMFPPY